MELTINSSQLLLLLLSLTETLFALTIASKENDDALLHPPTLTISYKGLRNCTLNPGDVCTFAIPAQHDSDESNVVTIEVKCHAPYPVMFSFDSVEHLIVSHTYAGRDLDLTEQRKIVTAFPLVVAYFMTLSLAVTRHREKPYNRTVFQCGPVQPLLEANGGPDPSQTVAVAFSVAHNGSPNSEQVEPTAYFRLIDADDTAHRWWSTTARLNRSDPNLHLEVLPKYATPTPNKGGCIFRCCLAPGFEPKGTGDNIRMWTGFCADPLACAPGPTGKFRKMEPVPSYEARVEEESRCKKAEWSCPAVVGRDFGHAFMCEIDLDDHPPSHVHSFLYFGGSGNESSMSFSSEWNKTKFVGPELPGSVSEAQVYIRDSLTFYCSGSQLGFGNTVVWERRYKGERPTEFSVSTGDYPHSPELRVQVTDDQLDSILCHLAPWDSSDWVTKSVEIIAKPPSPPVVPSGIPTNLTFYYRERVTLVCDFGGDPPPEVYWDLQNSGQENEDYPDYDLYTYGYETHENNKDILPGQAEVFVRGQWPEWIEIDPEIEILSAQISCTSMNPVGRADHTFTVQAVRFSPPVMASPDRDTVLVLNGNQDAAKVLNCTLARSDPPAEFYWKQNGANFTSGIVVKSGSSWSALLLEYINMALQSDANYTCLALNPVGNATKEFTVLVFVKENSQDHSFYASLLLAIVISVGLTTAGLVGFAFLVQCLRKRNLLRKQI